MINRNKLSNISSKTFELNVKLKNFDSMSKDLYRTYFQK